MPIYCYCYFLSSALTKYRYYDTDMIGLYTIWSHSSVYPWSKKGVWISIIVWSFPWKVLRTLCLKLYWILPIEALFASCYSAEWRPGSCQIRDQHSGFQLLYWPQAEVWLLSFHLFHLYRIRWFALLWILKAVPEPLIMQ